MSEPLGIPEIEELIGAYALDAVDPDERQAIEAHLVDCPRCQAELAEHLETASYLSYGGAAAPDELWGRIASALEEPPPAMRLQVVGGAASATTAAPVGQRVARASAPGRPLWWALGAAAAVIVVVMGVALVHQTNQVDHLNRNLAEAALSRSADQAMSNPASQHLSLVSPTGQSVSATAVISPSGTGFLMAPGLPALAADRTYQLWGVSTANPTGPPVSLGLLGRDPTLIAFSAHGTFKGLAITNEVAGGVTSSLNTPVVASKSI